MRRTFLQSGPAGKSRSKKAGQEVLARAGNIMVALAAFDVSVSLYQSAEIELRQGSRVICSSKRDPN
jgi:hypothetical protein